MSTTIGDNLHDARRRKGVTQMTVALAAGVTPKTISEWERGKAVPHLGYVEKIARYLQVPVADITDNVREPEVRPSSDGRPAERAPQVMVPICGSIKAGPLRIATQDAATDFMAAERGDIGSFVLVVDGDSMAPLYQPKDRVFVEPCDIRLEPLPRGVLTRIPLSQIDRIHKKDCICMVDGESTMKRVMVEPHGDSTYTVTLNPINPEYDKVTIKPETDFRVQGVVYKVVRFL